MKALKKIKYGLMVLAMVVGFAVLSQRDADAATITTLFNTGVNDDGTLRTNGETELHYSITRGPITGVPLVRTSAGGFPISSGHWPSYNNNSNWIVPNFDQDVHGLLNHPAGTYTFKTTFDLTGFDSSSANINVQWIADNFGSLFINGVDTGISASSPMASINSGFLQGLNTLEFNVLNFNPEQTTGNPTGLWVDIDGTADAEPVPEPTTIALLGIGLAGLAGAEVRRRRKKKAVDNS